MSRYPCIVAGATIGFLSAVAVGCSSHELGTGCTSDDQCRGQRICEAGACRPADFNEPPPPRPDAAVRDADDASDADRGTDGPLISVDVGADETGGNEPYTCRQVLYCGFFVCEEGDDTCQEDQFENASEEGQSKVRAYRSCTEENECGSAADPEQCREEECGMEREACVAAPENANGISCTAVLACLQQCGDDRECNSNCFRRGTRDAQQSLQAMFQCIEQQCGEGDSRNECIRTSCEEELRSCVGCRDF